jgi:hypothetical protein
MKIIKFGYECVEALSARKCKHCHKNYMRTPKPSSVLVSSTKRLTPKKHTYLAASRSFWEFVGSNGPITSSGRWWDSVSRQLEHYFTGLQGFSEGVIFVYPVSPNENTSFYTSRSYGSTFGRKKKKNRNL